jgi:hypothetical protein
VCGLCRACIAILNWNASVTIKQRTMGFREKIIWFLKFLMEGTCLTLYQIKSRLFVNVSSSARNETLLLLVFLHGQQTSQAWNILEILVHYLLRRIISMKTSTSIKCHLKLYIYRPYCWHTQCGRYLATVVTQTRLFDIWRKIPLTRSRSDMSRAELCECWREK